MLVPLRTEGGGGHPLARLTPWPVVVPGNTKILSPIVYVEVKSGHSPSLTEEIKLMSYAALVESAGTFALELVVCVRAGAGVVAALGWRVGRALPVTRRRTGRAHPPSTNPDQTSPPPPNTSLNGPPLCEPRPSVRIRVLPFFLSFCEDRPYDGPLGRQLPADRWCSTADRRRSTATRRRAPWAPGRAGGCLGFVCPVGGGGGGAARSHSGQHRGHAAPRRASDVCRWDHSKWGSAR